ncbi:MAG TPA: hypothetical protein PKD64_04395 [Pirellulaceae bacterium]|nr:hypothetical protein [Pirellulaceae bacterium]HMO91413.1 hypothetical protein [Pirellulaceae bacterium]HMP69638.1 hypothetical protein [Pirellulaceae bacterium]
MKQPFQFSQRFSTNRQITPLQWLLLRCVLFMLFVNTPASLYAQPPIIERDPVKQGQRAFSDQGQWSWYDTKTDSLKPLPPPPRRVTNSPQTNSSGKQGSSGNGAGSGTGDGSGNGASSGSEGSPSSFDIPAAPTAAFEGLSAVINVIAWIVVAILIVAVIVGIIWAILKLDRSNEEEAEEAIEVEQAPLTPADKLPFEIDPTISDFRSAAEQAYRKRDFRLATIYLFSHTLLILDRHRWLRLTRSKTNRQYLAELKDNYGLKQFYERLMILFEATFFGDQQIMQNQFEACWQALPQFEQSVQMGPPPTTNHLPVRPQLV